MTGSFSSINHERCQHYAQFMKSLNRQQADAVFGTLFVIMIILLTITSTIYSEASKILIDPETGSVDHSHRQKKRKKCLIVSSVCSVLGVVAVLFEAFALFSIQFCDGEDLMMLYWGIWTLVQIGSLIAIIGIMLSQWNALSGKELPPWNIALGTPVLVIAGVAHTWLDSFNSWWEKRKGISVAEKSTRSADGLTLNGTSTKRCCGCARAAGTQSESHQLRVVNFVDEPLPVL